jgi:hypothetical protein
LDWRAKLASFIVSFVSTFTCIMFPAFLVLSVFYFFHAEMLKAFSALIFTIIFAYINREVG